MRASSTWLPKSGTDNLGITEIAMELETLTNEQKEDSSQALSIEHRQGDIVQGGSHHS